jgi:hypothetical protein
MRDIGLLTFELAVDDCSKDGFTNYMEKIFIVEGSILMRTGDTYQTWGSDVHVMCSK